MSLLTNTQQEPSEAGIDKSDLLSQIISQHNIETTSMAESVVTSRRNGARKHSQSSVGGANYLSPLKRGDKHEDSNLRDRTPGRSTRPPSVQRSSVSRNGAEVYLDSKQYMSLKQKASQQTQFLNKKLSH
jgi:hypothetical protein